jgi:RNA polymerase sigma-70 factor (ECF subfamily)
VALKEIDLEPTGGRFPEHQALNQQSDEELLDQISLLTEREQEIIGLKFGAGFGNKKIAALIDLKENHVAVILYRAMNKLRKGLTEESER